MKRRLWSLATVVACAAGCASSEEMSRAPVLPGDSAPVSHPPPPTPPGESDDDTSLENWQSSVLKRADPDTLDLIEKDLQARIQVLQDRDTGLSYLPPGIALEERIRIARRIAFEKKRLELVEQAR